MKYKIVPIGTSKGQEPVFDLYEDRADAVRAVQACAAPAAFQIIQTAPDDLDVAASKVPYVQADIVRHFVRDCSVEDVNSLIFLFGSRHALLEALYVDTQRSAEIEIAKRALTMALLGGGGTPTARALAYLIIWFADGTYAERLGLSIGPLDAYSRLDRDIRDRIRPIFKAWLDGR